MTFDLAQTALDLERRLLELETRSDRAAIEELLHDDFCEHGASGRRWTRDEIVSVLVSENSSDRIVMADESTTLLDCGAVLVTSRSSRDGRDAWRSSVWVTDNGRCQIIFHQGTAISCSAAGD